MYYWLTIRTSDGKKRDVRFDTRAERAETLSEICGKLESRGHGVIQLYDPLILNVAEIVSLYMTEGKMPGN